MIQDELRKPNVRISAAAPSNPKSIISFSQQVNFAHEKLANQIFRYDRSLNKESLKSQVVKRMNCGDWKLKGTW